MAKHTRSNNRSRLTKLIVVVVAFLFVVTMIVVLVSGKNGKRNDAGQPVVETNPSKETSQSTSSSTPSTTVSPPAQNTPLVPGAINFTEGPSRTITVKKGKAVPIITPAAANYIKYRLKLSGKVDYQIPQKEIKDTFVVSNDPARVGWMRESLEVLSFEETGIQGFAMVKITPPSFLTGKKIENAAFKLYTNNRGQNIALFPSKTQWFETMNYDQAMSKIVPDVQVSTADVSQTTGWKGWDVTALVDKWIKNPSENFGFILTPVGQQDVYFVSSEGKDSSLRPRLEVSFEVSQTGSVKQSGLSKPLTVINTAGLPAGTYRAELTAGGGNGEKVFKPVSIVIK